MNEGYVFKTPIGRLKVCDKCGRITGLYLLQEDGTEDLHNYAKHSDLLYEAYKQINEYFAGNRREFDLPLEPEGTPFQQMVWRELQNIPYGETRSYEDIAVAIGNKRAVRAVGQANGRNPIIIIIPCHRVICKSGDIAGFSCGVDVKRYLLALENGMS